MKIAAILICAFGAAAVGSTATEPISLYTQSATRPLAFEVATVKPYRPPAQTPMERWYIGPMCQGVDNVPSDVVSMTPMGRCLLQEVSLRRLVAIAYTTNRGTGSLITVTGGPRWIDDELWEVQGKAEAPTTTTFSELVQMLQTLLGERFKLKYHRETVTVPGFKLVTAPRGALLTPGDGNAPAGMTGSGAQVMFRNAPLYYLVRYLASRLKVPVEDQTGLAGTYTMSLIVHSEQSTPEADDQALRTAVEQLGLRLETQRVTQERIVVENAERPSDR